MDAVTLERVVEMMLDMGETQMLRDVSGFAVLIEIRSPLPAVDVTSQDAPSPEPVAYLAARDRAVAALWNTCLHQNLHKN